MAVFLAPAIAFLCISFLVPLVVLVTTSFGEPLWTLKNYAELVSRPLYLVVFRNTLEISLLSTAFTLLAGYPIAYHLARQSQRRRALLIILVLLPFWTSILVKSFAFTVLLGQNGIINTFLAAALGEQARLPLLFNRAGVIIGMAHFLMPFMVFTVLASLLNQNPDLRQAAEIMGSGRIRIFCRITLPLSMPGVLAGVLLCMILSMGMFITPALLGGRGDIMISNLVDFHVRETLEWNVAAALAMCLIGITAILTFMLSRVKGGQLFDTAH